MPDPTYDRANLRPDGLECGHIQGGVCAKCSWYRERICALLDDLDRAEAALREIDTAASAVCDAIEQGKCDLAELVPGRIREVARAALKEAEDG